MNHASKRYNHKSPNNMYGISPVRSDGNPAVRIEGGGGQQSYLYSVKLSLHCKDSEFPSNFDVVPKILLGSPMQSGLLVIGCIVDSMQKRTFNCDSSGSG